MNTQVIKALQKKPRSCERGGFQWVIWFDDGLKNSLLSVDSCLLNSRQFILLWYIVIQNRILFYGMLNKIVKFWVREVRTLLEWLHSLFHARLSYGLWKIANHNGNFEPIGCKKYLPLWKIPKLFWDFSRFFAFFLSLFSPFLHYFKIQNIPKMPTI